MELGRVGSLGGSTLTQEQLLARMGRYEFSRDDSNSGPLYRNDMSCGKTSLRM
jgi:hypothetical protein